LEAVFPVTDNKHTTTATPRRFKASGSVKTFKSKQEKNSENNSDDTAGRHGPDGYRADRAGAGNMQKLLQM